MAQRHGREFWRGMVEEYERVGGEQRAFATSRGLNLATFQHWLYRFRKEGGAGVRMLPVRVTPSASAAVIELSVAGVVLRVPSDVELSRVVALVAALEGRAC